MSGWPMYPGMLRTSQEGQPGSQAEMWHHGLASITAVHAAIRILLLPHYWLSLFISKGRLKGHFGSSSMNCCQVFKYERIIYRAHDFAGHYHWSWRVIVRCGDGRSWQECSAVSLQPQDSISYIESWGVNLHACRIILAVSSQAIDQDEGWMLREGGSPAATLKT